MKRKAVFLLITILLSGVMGACKGNQVSQANAENTGKEEIVIRIAAQPSQTQPAIAQKKGFFEEEFGDENIKVELKIFASGPPIIEAFTAGELDFGQVGDQPAIQGAANGLEIKAIASYASSETGNALIAAKDSGINSLTDLKGKKIGYTTGSVGHQLLLKFLEDAGLSETDAELLNLSPGDIYTSLQSGSIDGAVTWEPYISNSVNEEIAEIIQDGIGYKYNVNVIIGRTEFLEQYPDISARVLKVLDRAAKWAEENKEETLAILAEESGLDASAFEASLNKFDQGLFLDERKITSVKESALYLLDQGLIRKAVDVDELIDTSYLERAEITE